MALRSKAREVVIQLLFQHDQNSKPMAAVAVRRFAEDRLRHQDLVKFALKLYEGVVTNRAGIDELIVKTAENWRLVRMMPSDRNVLRLGTYELRFAAEPEPTPIVLNESIELAKRFGTAESALFVNGILDKIANPATPTAAVTSTQTVSTPST